MSFSGEEILEQTSLPGAHYTRVCGDCTKFCGNWPGESKEYFVNTFITRCSELVGSDNNVYEDKEGDELDQEEMEDVILGSVSMVGPVRENENIARLQKIEDAEVAEMEKILKESSDEVM